MSSQARFRLTSRAVEDLRNIGRYSRKTWGRDQGEDYLRALYNRLDWLAKNPHRGRARDDIAPGYFCFSQGSHLIFYLISDVGVDVIGILHQAMDMTNQLKS